MDAKVRLQFTMKAEARLQISMKAQSSLQITTILLFPLSFSPPRPLLSRLPCLSPPLHAEDAGLRAAVWAAGRCQKIKHDAEVWHFEMRGWVNQLWGLM